MLQALGAPTSFLVLLLVFVGGFTLSSWLQALLAVRFGNLGLRRTGQASPNPQHQVEVFGALAGVLGGVGWGKQVDLPRRRGQAWAVALVGPVVLLALGVGLLLTWRFAFHDGGSALLAAAFGHAGAGYFLLHGSTLLGDGPGVCLLLAGASLLYLGVLALVPIPPLAGGRLLLALAPQTLNWQKARYYLVEQNIGLAACLLLLIPLGSDRGLLLRILDSFLTPAMKGLLGV